MTFHNNFRWKWGVGVFSRGYGTVSAESRFSCELKNSSLPGQNWMTLIGLLCRLTVPASLSQKIHLHCVMQLDTICFLRCCHEVLKIRCRHNWWAACVWFSTSRVQLQFKGSNLLYMRMVFDWLNTVCLPMTKHWTRFVGARCKVNTSSHGTHRLTL